MDIPRPSKKKWGRWVAGAGITAAVLLMTVAVSSLEPAAPTVEAAGIWRDTVERGTMIRQVRGPGTLVPEGIRYITAGTNGRVERILATPGATVTAETPLLILSNPEVELRALDAQRDYDDALGTLVTLEAQLEMERLTQQSSRSDVAARLREAQRQLAADQTLAQSGAIATLELRRREDEVKQLEERLVIEDKRLAFGSGSMQSRLAAQRSQIERLARTAQLQRSYVNALTVRAGTDGVLRELPLTEGEVVGNGARVAVVVQPQKLKAELRIPETQIKDVAIGQRASIDTRNGVIPGRVTRIDPAVVNSTITVDVALEGALPRGARPDLTVDGVIEIERLENVLHVGRPAYGQAESTVGLFVVDPAGTEARRRNVQLGRTSVSTIEIRGGLNEGEVVILSDISQWDSADRLKLR